jgi:hypothetical protein
MAKKEKVVIHLYDERGNDKASRVSVGVREVYRGSYESCESVVTAISKSFDNIGVDYDSEEKEM